MINARYDIYLDTQGTGRIRAAECVIEEEGTLTERVGFRYTPEFIEHPNAFALDPVQLPLKPRREYLLQCKGGIPGFLDDYLPDDWGRKILAQLAFYRDKKRLNRNSTIDALSLISHSRIGALSIVPAGETPLYDYGAPVSEISKAERASHELDHLDYREVNVDEMSLLYLANAGSGVGGARPKALVTDNSNHYVAKFNRLQQDAYNNARVELACLNMARVAGIEVGKGRVIEGINDRDVLLLERFDVNNDQQRRHLVSINTLLKEANSQRDHGGVFKYDDMCELLRRYSINIEADLKQLLRLMLFNRAINNTDDHERNFSFINDGCGYQLSPAYDLVPSLTVGQYHVAGYGLSPYPPKPSEVEGLGKVFGLPKTIVSKCAEQVLHAVSKWPDFAAEQGVGEEEIDSIKKCLNL